MSPRNAFYAQSGGVTAVINASACGLIQAARRQPDRIGRIYAGHNGILGALTESLIDTTLESDEAIAALRYTPAGAFGSCRYKLKSPEENRAQYVRLMDVFKAHDIGYFFYNGGGDSADTCLKVSSLSASMGYPLQAIHIPKTVDNDLPLTDCSPGFGSVAKYVATAVREASFDVRSMAASSTRVFVLEVMGRHAGWIAAAGALAADQDNDLPILLLLPEVAFDPEALVAEVKQRVATYGYCSVVVSEGVRDSQGRFLAEAGLSDAFGHAQLGGVAPLIADLIRRASGYKCHWAVADYLQRAARHIASRVDVEQAYALGEAALALALEGHNAIMPGLVRLSDVPYQWQIVPAPLSQVANVEKKMPLDFISADGYGITAACRTYLQPLIEGEDYPPYKRGLPDYVTLKNQQLAKQLPAFSF